MRGFDTGLVLRELAILVAVVGLVTQAHAANLEYDFTGYAVSSGDMETVFGTKVAELDAAAYGYDFGAFNETFRNLNIISHVYQATQTVVIGTGDGNNTPITLNPGDYTFAYTLVYSPIPGGALNSPVNDLQLYRVIDDDFFNFVSNPGPNIALEEVLAGAYNTDAEFGAGAGTPPFEPYAAGVTGESLDFAGFVTGEVEYSWPAGGQVDPDTDAMVLLFTSPDVQIWQMGWGSSNGQGVAELVDRQTIGDTGEGGNVIGGGANLDGIPVLIPVVPEPTVLTLLLLAGISILRRRR